MNYIFIYTEQTAHGEFVRIIVEETKEKAYNAKDYTNKSLKDLGWNTSPERIMPAHSSVRTGIIFDGGGSNG